MTKNEFLTELRAALAGLPEEDVEKSLEYYSEMIDDRIEDGLSEEESVADLGSIEDIRKQILKDTPITKIIKENSSFFAKNAGAFSTSCIFLRMIMTKE